MKRIIALVVLVFLLINAMGYYFLFELKKHLIRKEMQELVASGRMTENYTVLTINDHERNPEFKRADKKEFRYQGRLYDIIREVRKGNTVVYYCYRDKKEEILFSNLRKTRQVKLFSFLSRHLLTQALPWGASSNPSQSGMTFPFLPYNFTILGFSPVIPVPPPEFL